MAGNSAITLIKDITMKPKIQNWQYWVLQNIVLLSKRYGKRNIIFNNQNWQSIFIKNYALPYNWRKQTTFLLILLPKSSQILYNPPDRFYIEKNLKAYNGKRPTHYYEDSGFNDLSRHNLARFSFHVEKGWNPNLNSIKGTNLLHVLDGLQKGMYKAAQEVLK